jgi:hypothetical protein
MTPQTSNPPSNPTIPTVPAIKPAPAWLQNGARGFRMHVDFAAGKLRDLRQQILPALMTAALDQDATDEQLAAELTSPAHANVTGPERVALDAWFGELRAEIKSGRAKAKAEARATAEAAAKAESDRAEAEVEAKRRADLSTSSAWEAADLKRRDAEAEKWQAYEAESGRYREWKAAQKAGR